MMINNFYVASDLVVIQHSTIYTYFPTYFQFKWLYLSLWEFGPIKDGNIVINDLGIIALSSGLMIFFCIKRSSMIFISCNKHMIIDIFVLTICSSILLIFYILLQQFIT